ncbi:MFS transporter [Modestobacter sp. SSW1-42]|uniref:MFS transporter n=1 Tax=Modestobacter sp. SSW1-42 TaxID=596372 RepID=UPI003986EA5F
MALEPGPARTCTSWAAVVSLAAAGVVAAVQIGKGAAALPVLTEQFGLSSAAAAWFLSVVSAMGAAAGALLGWLGQGLGFRRQVQLGLLAVVLANLAGAVAASTPWLLGARVAEGLGFVLVVLAAPALLPSLAAPGHRRLVVGGWGVYMPVGSGLAVLFVPPALTGWGWPVVCLADAACTAAVLVAVARWVPPGPVRRLPRVDGLTRALRAPGVLCVSGLFALYAAQYLAVVGLLPTLLVGAGQLSLPAAGTVTAAVFLVNAPSNLLGALLLHRGWSRRALFLGGAACMAATVWPLFDPGRPLGVRIAAALTFSACSGVVPAAAFSGVVAMSARSPSAGASVGLLMQGSGIGQLLGPPLVVAAGAAGGWTARPLVLGALAAGLAVAGLAYGRLERPVATGPAAVTGPPAGPDRRRRRPRSRTR